MTNEEKAAKAAAKEAERVAKAEAKKAKQDQKLEDTLASIFKIERVGTEPTTREEDLQTLGFLTSAYIDETARRTRLLGQLGVKSDGTPQDLVRVWNKDDYAILKLTLAQVDFTLNLWREQLKNVVQRFPIWAFFEGISGIKATGAAMLIRYIRPAEDRTISSMWQYAGMNPKPVRGCIRVEKSKYKKAMGPIKYEIRDHKGKVSAYAVLTETWIAGDRPTKGFILPYNKELRKWLCGIIVPCLYKAGVAWVDVTQDEYDALPESGRRENVKKDGSEVLQRRVIKNKWVCVIENYKHRLATSSKITKERVFAKGPDGKMGWTLKDVAWKDAKPAHRHAAAIRYCAKELLKDLYNAWWPLEGLTVRPTYQEEKQGHVHSKPEEVFDYDDSDPMDPFDVDMEFGNEVDKDSGELGEVA